MITENKTKVFAQGLKDGIPIALGYFAVAFSLGIAAKDVGFTPVQGFITSFLCMASAGEHALFILVRAGASYIEVMLAALVTNARYFLMSCALSQRISPEMKNIHRFGVGLGVTDEIFGTTIARPGMLEPLYNYGVMALAMPGWSIGTALGILMGNLLPDRIVSALSVALYGMFLATIIPPMKKDKAITLCVLSGFAFSYAFGIIPVISSLSAGTRTIILTVFLSSAAALLFPVKEAAPDEK